MDIQARSYCGRIGAIGLSLAAFVALQFPPEGIAADAEETRGFGVVAFTTAQDGANVFGFDLVERWNRRVIVLRGYAVPSVKCGVA